MARDYRDAVAVVTGAGGGIGRALAVGLSSRGARLALVGRRPEPLRETARLTGGRALVLACDVSDAGAVAALCERVEAGLGEVEVLVNNAGRGAYGPFQEVPLADHRAVVDTNLMGVIHLTHRVLPSMLRRGRGQLVFVSSVLGELPSPDHAVYGATKFAVTGLGESLAHELHGTGVTVTVVEPGLVPSGFHQVSGTPMERFGQVPSKSPEEAAAEVLRAMERQRRHHVADRWVGLAIRLRRLAPRSFHWVFRRVWSRMRRRERAPADPS